MKILITHLCMVFTPDKQTDFQFIMKLGGVAFLRIFVMFVNVDMSKTALIAGESRDSAAIFIKLLKCFCEVLTIIFRMHVYVW